MSNIPNNNILLRISALLEERNWTIYRLSKESDVPYTSISNMFARNTEPTVHTLSKICDGFGISLSTFFNTPLTRNPNTFVLNDEERNLIDLYRCLDSPYRALMKNYLESLAVIAAKQKK